MNEFVSNIVFSLNTVLPVFLMIFVGYYMRRRGAIGQNFVDTASHIVFYYALPASMFLDVATSDFFALLNLRFVLFTVLGTLAVFLAAWAVIAALVKDRRQVSAAVHSAFRGNYIYIGLPLLQNMLQTTDVPTSVLIVTFVLPVYNILGVLIMSYYSEDGSKVKPGKLVLDILKNPMIIAVICGVLYGLTGLSMPYAADKTLSYLGSICTPLALIMIGGRIQADTIRGKEKLLGLSLAFKVVLGPLVMTLLAVALGFSAMEIASVYVIFSVPTALNVFIMTKSMGGDDGLAAGAILTSVLASVVTMPIGIYLLRAAGII